VPDSRGISLFKAEIVAIPKPTSLTEVIGTARLASYFATYPGRDELVVRLYSWNIALSAALWGPLGVLEVATRNAIHQQLADRAGRSDWWEDRRLSATLVDREWKSLHDAILTSARRKHYPTPDDVVAATGFGFWVGLLGAGVPRHPVQSYETSLWQPRLHRAFPDYSGGRKRLHAELDLIRGVRNRVAHHEPVFRSDVGNLIDRIARVAGYIDPHAEAYIRANERVSTIVAAKRDFVEHGRTFI